MACAEMCSLGGRRMLPRCGTQREWTPISSSIPAPSSAFSLHNTFMNVAVKLHRCRGSAARGAWPAQRGWVWRLGGGSIVEGSHAQVENTAEENTHAAVSLEPDLVWKVHCRCVQGCHTSTTERKRKDVCLDTCS